MKTASGKNLTISEYLKIVADKDKTFEEKYIIINGDDDLIPDEVCAQKDCRELIYKKCLREMMTWREQLGYPSKEPKIID